MNERERMNETAGRPDQRPAAPAGYPYPPQGYPQGYPQPPLGYYPPPFPQGFQGYPHPGGYYPQPYYPPQRPPASAAGSSVDDAVSQIAARMRALEGAPAEPTQAAMPQGYTPPSPGYPQGYAPNYAPGHAQGPDLSGLENQLRNITAQIETLRQPVPDFSVVLKELRNDLSEISQRLNEAMPRKAVEALETEVRRLAERIDISRAAGVDPDTISGMERGLNEVRDALRSLKPAESFAGFEEAIRNLSAKMDQAGTSYQDPASLQQLETAITALRGIVANVASNDMLTSLSEEVRGLSAKVDRVAASSQTLDAESLKSLEERIAGLPVMNAIERGFADLKARLDSLQVSPQALIDTAPAVDHLKRDLVRTQDSLEAVHSTLGHLVDRLAMIEGGIREARFAAEAPGPSRPSPAQPSPSKPVAPQSSAPLSHETLPIAPVVGAPPPSPRPAAPNLPPDYPLEPGSGAPRVKASAAERIAASEAALGATKPENPGQPGQSNFIAAARRAAQAAASEAEADETKPDGDADEAAKSMGQKMRSLFVGVVALLIAVAGVRVALDFFEGDGSSNVAEFSEPLDTDVADTPSPAPSSPQIVTGSTLQPKVADPFGTMPSGVVIPERPKVVAPPPVSPPDSNATGSIVSRTPQAAPDASRGPIPALSDKLPTALRNAALKGQPAADYEIGIRLIEGRGVAQNTEEGVRWLERAADAGLAPAHFRLGGLYEKGLGTKKNLDLARRYYVIAADKGHAKAMHNLAVLYAEGVEGKPDYRSAGQWFRRAAEHGVADSQYNLGILYARGIGIEQNLPESYKWFALAALQGDRDAAKKRDDVAGKLDAASLAAARSAVQTFAPQSQPDDAVTVQTPPGGWDRPAAETPPAPKKPRTSAKVTAS